MARNYKRDSRGRFATSNGLKAKIKGKLAKRRSAKATRLVAKNKRIKTQYTQDKSLHGTPFGHSIERRIARRDAKINRLRR